MKKCQRCSILCCVVTIVSAMDFRKQLAIFDSGGASGGIVLSLPLIASNDPIIYWVWSFIASLHMSQLQDKIEAVNELVSLAKDNDRSKHIIVEEDGILPLLKLLKVSLSLKGQITAIHVLFKLANDEEIVEAIIDELGVPIIVQVLGGSPLKIQIRIANLVVKMLGFGSSLSKHFSVGSSKEGSYMKERENKKPEMKLKLKISCAEALWILARGSVPNSRRIMETKGLLCLSELIKIEECEFQSNCLMTIMVITATTEYNANLRRSTSKTNPSAAKAVVDQLLRVIKDSDDPRLHIAAIRIIGCLARKFPARETRVIGLLVKLLTIFSLGKFACLDNFLCVEHCKIIIEFIGVPPLMRLLRENERAYLHITHLVLYVWEDRK
ncbi:hypothetical protein Pfo_026853 [Paulownia fortunei]|nr:hypothetical protein Pfo_026853 [Paulownia fortunei]